MAKVSILQGPGAGREYELEDVTVLGRLETNGIPIEDTLASREHARIERRDGRWILFDLGSSNGTRVNGDKVDERVLRSGDRIVIGTARMCFEDPDQEESEEETTVEPEPADDPIPEPALRVAAGPRVFPQQYWLLLGCLAIALGCLTVWEREHVTGKDVYGFQMIVGAFTLLFGAFGTIEAVLGIVQGRLRVGGAFAAGLAGLLYGLKSLSRIVAHEGFRSYAELGDSDAGTHQAVLAAWVGQVGPGVWLTLFGSAIIAGVFARAMLGSSRGAGSRRGRPA